MMNRSGQPTAVRTLLADDSRVDRRAVGRLLSGEPRIALVGLAATFQETLHLIEILKPDVIVIDLGMTEAANGESAKLRQISNAFMVAISALFSEDSASLAHEIGADVFLDKMSLNNDLIPAILGAHPEPPSTP